MTLGSHLTPLVKSYIEKSDVVFAALSDGITEMWLSKMHPDVRSFQPLYREGKPRMQTYREMVEACRSIVDGDGSDDQKRSACLDVLGQHTGRMAIAHWGEPDVELRFYLDMFVLRQQLMPSGHTDELARLALWPMLRQVSDWLDNHTKNRGEANSNKATNVTAART